MQFSDHIQMEKGVFHSYKLYGSTSCVTPSTPQDVIFIRSPLNEMQFSDCIQMENDPFHPYKLNKSTSCVIPLTLLELELYSTSPL